MTLLKPYQYQPLKSIADIRVFALEPNEGEAPLRGRIVAFTTEEIEGGFVQYEAISYVWGHASDKVLLDCYDGYVDIPRNLSFALHHMRRRDSIRYVWADSISINQKDAPEKSLVVGRMYKIFGQAERVVMWLGALTPDTTRSLSTFRALCEAVFSGPDSDEYKKIYETMQYAIERPRTYVRDPLLAASRDPDWTSLAALFSRSYFSRLWVLQEAIAPRRAVLKLGDAELDWQVIRRAAPVLASKFWGLTKVFHAVSDNVAIGYNLRNILLMAIGVRESGMLRVQASESNNLLSVLLCTSTLSTTEPADALFAILHLTTGISIESKQDHDLLPDYQASPGQVFWRLAIWLIVKHQQYDYLTFSRAYLGEYPGPILHVDGIRLKDQQASLRESTAPSWVPPRLNAHNYTGYYYRLAALGSEVKRARPARAGGDSSVPQMPELSADRRVLGLLGKLVDQVESLATRPVSEFIADKALSPSSLDSRPELGVKAADYLMISLKEIYGERWLDVLRSEATFRLIQYVAALAGGTKMSLSIVRTIDELSEENKLDCGARYVQYLEDVSTHDPSSGPTRSDLDLDDRFQDLSRLFLEFVSQHKLCRTRAGRLGWVPWHTEKTDVICVLNQVCVPLALRPDANGDTFTVVGECCINSIMHGEALAFDMMPTERIRLS